MRRGMWSEGFRVYLVASILYSPLQDHVANMIHQLKFDTVMWC
jgi:hypothetical protein